MYHYPRPYQSNNRNHPQQRLSSVRANRTINLPRGVTRCRQRLSASLQTRLRQVQTSFACQCCCIEMVLKHAQQFSSLSQAEDSRLADGGAEEKRHATKFARVGHEPASCGVVAAVIAEQGV